MSSKGSPADHGGSVRLLSDLPLDDRRRDFFGFVAYADALAELIDNESTDTPITVAISAPWGAGKTSVARMIERRLKAWTELRQGDRPNVVCWFNAWMHDDAPHLGAAMAASVAGTVNGHRRRWRRIAEPLPAAMLSIRERWLRRVGLGVLSAVVAAFVASRHEVREALSSSSGEQAAGVAALGGTALVVAVFGLLWRRVFSTAQSAVRFFDDPASESARGSLEDVRKQLGRLIQQAVRGGRLVIFVDDLERCPPERAVEVCEVAAQLLTHPGVVTVFIADMHVIAQSAERRFVGEAKPGDQGRRFLEKIVQLELTLPPPRSEDMQRLLRGRSPEWIAANDEPATEIADYGQLPLQNVVRLSAVAITIAITTAISILAGWRYLGAASPQGPLGWVAYFAALTLFNVAFPTLMIELWRLRAQSVQRRVHEDVASVIRATAVEVPQEDLASAVYGEIRVKHHDVADKLLQSYLIDSSKERKAVDAVIFRYPPKLPRGAKRMLNNARLLTYIARQRGVFDNDLVAEHLGKWIVIHARWPLLARHIEGDPAWLDTLEKAADGGQDVLNDRLRQDGLDLDELPELRDMLTRPPLLGVVAQRLIHNEPAPAHVQRLGGSSNAS